jgi:hypothetical protein
LWCFLLISARETGVKMVDLRFIDLLGTGNIPRFPPEN